MGSNVFYPKSTVFFQTVLENFGEPKDPIFFSAQPMSVRVQKNSFREADTFSITVDARSFPLSPGLIRGMGVQIYLYDSLNVSSFPKITSSDVLEAGISPIMTGLVDSVHTQYGTDGNSVTITGRDYTSLFLDAQYPTGCVQTGGGRLSDIILNLIRQVDVFIPNKNDPENKELGGNIRLRVVPDDDTTPLIGKKSKKSQRKHIPVQKGKSYWDVMFDIASRAGYVIFVEGNDVVLTKLQDYLLGKADNVYTMVFGKNISAMRQKRNLGTQRAPRFRVISYDPGGRKKLQVTFPKAGVKVASGIGVNRDEIKVLRVPGVIDKKTMEDIARSSFHLLSRGEEEIFLETMDLVDAGDALEDLATFSFSEGLTETKRKSLMNLTAGDPIAVQVDERFNEILQSRSTEERQNLIQQRLDVDALTAFEMAVAYETVFGGKGAKYFRANRIEYDFEVSSGLRINMEVHNFANIKDLDP